MKGEGEWGLGGAGRGAGASGGQGVSPPGNPTATSTTSGSELRGSWTRECRECRAGRCFFWEDRQDERETRPHLVRPPQASSGQRLRAQRAPSMCAPHPALQAHRVKGWELGRAAGHLRKNSWCGEGQAQVQGRTGGEGASCVGVAPVSGPGGGTHRAVCTGEVFFLRPGPSWLASCQCLKHEPAHQHP